MHSSKTDAQKAQAMSDEPGTFSMDGVRPLDRFKNWMGDYPRNNAQWTKQEVQVLIHSFRAGKSLARVVSEHGRPPHSVEGKLKKVIGTNYGESRAAFAAKQAQEASDKKRAEGVARRLAALESDAVNGMTYPVRMTTLHHLLKMLSGYSCTNPGEVYAIEEVHEAIINYRAGQSFDVMAGKFVQRLIDVNQQQSPLDGVSVVLVEVKPRVGDM